ncbi:autotransporter domain-containing protein [Pseudomonas sp. AOB-7]|nr:autotransporter domain-containing protein [Pseudomonas sp. AOB-7]
MLVVAALASATAWALDFTGNDTASGTLDSGALEQDINFRDSSSAGSASISNPSDSFATFFLDDSNAGSASISNSDGGLTIFDGRSSAANSTIDGDVQFLGQSTAGNARLSVGFGSILFAGQSSAGDAEIRVIGANSVAVFAERSTAGNARLISESGGFFSFTGGGPNDDGILSAGSIEGDGVFDLGSVRLGVGGNNLSTEVSGSIMGGVDSALIKRGSGVLTLSGFNSSFTGELIVEQGLVNFGDPSSLGSGSLTLNGGGLQWAVDNGFDISDRLAPLGPNGGVFDTNGNDVLLSSAIVGSGSLTKTGAGLLDLLGPASYSGATIVQAGTLRQGSSGGFVQNGAYVIDGGALDLNSVGLSMGSLSGSGGQVLLGSADLVVDQALDTSYAGAISGSGGLSKLGAGLLLLEGENDYSGLTQVSDGTLRQGGAGAFVAGGSYLVSGGVLDLNGFDLSMGSLSGSGGEVALGGADLTLVQTSDSSFSGVISGSGGLIKQGDGLLLLSGANSYSGTTRIDGGTLRQGAAGALAGGDYAINAGVLDLNGFDLDMGSLSGSGGEVALGAANLGIDQTVDGTFSGVIGGSGGLRKSGDGTLVLAGANSYGGVTQVTGGTLRQGSAGAFVDGGVYVVEFGVLDLNGFDLSMSALTGGGGEVALGSADLTLAMESSGNFSGSISGSGSLIKQGDGLLMLSGDSSYSGATKLRGGTLLQGSPGAFVSGGDYVIDGGVLDLNDFALSMGSLSGNGGEVALGSADLTLVQAVDGSFLGVISGSGGLIKQGGGTLTLSGNNSYSGVTRVEAGTLRQDSAGGLVSGGAYELGGGVLDLGGFDLSMSALAGAGGQVALSGATLTVDQASDTSFAGAILGSGAFVKDGPGTLDLGGSHGIAGITEVRGGTLVVNGSLLSAIQVQSGGTLGGAGSVGNVQINSGGTLAPGNSIGTLNVAGDLIFSPGSVYQVETDAAGNADQVMVSGLASLAGTVQVLAENGTYAPATSYGILSAGQLSGQFDSVSSNLAFLDPSLSYAGNAVTLTLTRNDTSFSSLARTPNQVAFAQAAESLDEDNEVYRTLLDLGEDEVADTFNKLSGDAHASIASAVMFDDLNLSRAPLGNLRRNLASPERALPYWVQVGGGRQRIDDDGNAGEIIQDHESMLFGGDWPVYGDWRLGGAFGYGQEQLDVDSRDAKADSDSYRYALYGGRDVELSRGTLKLFGGGGYSQHQIDSQRDVRLIDGPERLTRQYDVNTAQGFGELAWHLKFDEPAYVEPFVGLLLIDQRSDSFSEQGGAAALSADSQRNELLSTSLGVRGQQLFQLAERDLLLNGSFTWRQINGDLRPELDLQLEGGDKFRVLGTELPRNSFLVELNLDYSITPNIVLDVDYNGVFSDSSEANNIAFNLRWKM